MRYFIAKERGRVFDSFFPRENLELLDRISGGDVIFNTSDRRLSGEEASALCRNADVFVTAWGAPRLDGEILDANPNIKLLVHLCGTVVPVAAPEVFRRGVRVLSGNAFFAESVAEGTLAYMLSALRDIPFYSRELKERHIYHRMQKVDTRGLLGRTVGIVSYGAVARNLVRMLQPFGVRIKIYDIFDIPREERLRYNMEQVALDEVFLGSDIISLHTALNDATEGMIDARLLSMIPDGAIFINTARGGLIAAGALEEELKKQRFTAFLDVYAPCEPPSDDSPLYTLPNVYMMPHMAGPTSDRRRVITDALLREADGFLNRGEALTHEVTREAFERMSRK